MRPTSQGRCPTPAAVAAAGLLVLAGAFPAWSQMTQTDQTTKPGEAAADVTSQSGQQISDLELQQHARAHEALEQKAPDLLDKLKTSRDPAADFKGEERQQIEQALKGTGLSFEEFARVHAAVMTDPQVQSRFAQIAQQARAQSGGSAQQPAGTSDTSGATSGGAAAPAPGSPKPRY